ncbi:TetR/AcrR family transcriptional regulator [Actinomycetes bacterium KLBMP 9759]
MTKRRPQTRARLIEAATEVFAERGFHGTSIEDICQHAGYTRGAFYSNFASKDELLLALFDVNSERVLERLRAIELPDGDTDVFAAAVAAAATPPSDDRTWFLITTEFTLYAVRNPEAAAALNERDARLRTSLAELIGDLYARAGTAPVVDLEDLARFVVAVVEGSRTQSHLEPDVLPPGKLERQFLPAVLGALAAPRR